MACSGSRHRPGEAFLWLLHRGFSGLENRWPLGGAITHELDLLLPPALRNEQDGRPVLLPKFEAQLNADSFLRAVNALPSNLLAAPQFEDLPVVKALVVEPELNDRSYSARRTDVLFPLVGQACLFDKAVKTLSAGALVPTGIWHSFFLSRCPATSFYPG